MEALFTSLNQHVSSLVNIYIIKNVNTGDRMLDSTIQGIATLVSASLIALIVGIYKSGAIYSYIILLLSYCNLSSFSSIQCDPLKFNPTSAPGKSSRNSSGVFMYTSVINGLHKGAFWVWFYKHHSTKKYKFDTLNNSLTIPINNVTLDSSYNIIKDISDLEEMMKYDPAINHQGLMNNLTGSDKVMYLPIWYDYTAFEWVYLGVKSGTSSSSFSLVSDSSIAITNCYNSIKEDTHYNEYKSQYMNNKKSKLTIIKIIHGNAKKDGYINTKKRFDTLKFENKEYILNILQKFKDDTLYPSHLALDNKLGIILHGPPGTGKTGFISCLANYLDRNVLIVNMNTIKTCSELDSIFFKDTAEDNNYIYVFEEFDSMKCVLRRDIEEYTKANNTTTTNDNSYLMMLMSEKSKSEDIMNIHKEQQNKLNDTLTLGYLLQTLDGIQSCNGRVIIATTNYPERIDSALLRPGRFGLSIHLKNCSKQILTEIIGMIYQTNITLDDVKDIPDYKWSPVQVMQQGIMEPDYKSLIQKLIHGNPTEFN